MTKLWRISQQTNSNYDTFDSAVVSADTAEDARKVHPGGDLYQQHQGVNWWEKKETYSSWCNALDQVEVELLGEATANLNPGTVICASFNAG